MALVINTETQFCAVIGNPVGHSLSMRAMIGFRGLSVTIPHKVDAMAHVDELTPMARQVGCINTVTNEGGRLVGSVTDGTGTLRAFQQAKVDPAGKRVLFLGAGGAVRAVAFAFALESGCAGVTVLARSRDKARALARDLSPHATCPVAHGHLSEDIEQAMAEHDIIIHGTPVGMYPHHENALAIPEATLRREHIVFDMVYRPLETALIHAARERGCQTILGTEMLVQQAAEQFETWTAVEAPVDVMRDALLSALSKPAP